MRYPFTASNRSISIFFNGRMHAIPETHEMFTKLHDHLKLPNHDADIVRDCVDQSVVISELTLGNVTVVESTVFYKGEALHDAVCAKLLDMLRAGFDAKPWAEFIDLLMRNPSERSRKTLYDFLSKFDAPITEDGHFIVFKKVRDNYRDIYSGRFDNSPGTVVSMDREDVNDNPEKTCSSGLHVCSFAYLPHFGDNSSNRVVACKVSPEDVVSVPVDYNHAKMRVCRYEVLADVAYSGSSYQGIATQQVFSETSLSADRSSDEGDIETCIHCQNEGEFSKRWALDSEGIISFGSLVVDLSMDWRVGRIHLVDTNKHGIIYGVTWQDGDYETVSDYEVELYVVKPRYDEVFGEYEPDAVEEDPYEDGSNDVPDMSLAFPSKITPDPALETFKDREAISLDDYMTIGFHRIRKVDFDALAMAKPASDLAHHFGCSMLDIARALTARAEAI